MFFFPLMTYKYFYYYYFCCLISCLISIFSALYCPNGANFPIVGLIKAFYSILDIADINNNAVLLFKDMKATCAARDVHTDDKLTAVNDVAMTTVLPDHLGGFLSWGEERGAGWLRSKWSMLIPDGPLCRL